VILLSPLPTPNKGTKILIEAAPTNYKVLLELPTTSTLSIATSKIVILLEPLHASKNQILLRPLDASTKQILIQTTDLVKMGLPRPRKRETMANAKPG